MRKITLFMISLMMIISLCTTNIFAASLQPFYGVWVAAAKNRNQANRKLREAKKHGFNSAGIYTSTQWTNLNKKGYYLISTGEYHSQYKAAQALKKAKKVYKSAYIRYTGKHKGQILKASKLAEGWYTGLGDDPYSDHSLDYGLIKSMSLKKSGNKYYVFITGRLNRYYFNSKHPSYPDEENDFADQLPYAKRMIPLSDKCVFIEMEDRNYSVSRKQFFSQRLPSIDNKILIRKHQIVRMIVSA